MEIGSSTHTKVNKCETRKIQNDNTQLQTTKTQNTKLSKIMKQLKKLNKKLFESQKMIKIQGLKH